MASDHSLLTQTLLQNARINNNSVQSNLAKGLMADLSPLVTANGSVQS